MPSSRENYQEKPESQADKSFDQVSERLPLVNKNTEENEYEASPSSPLKVSFID